MSKLSSFNASGLAFARAALITAKTAAVGAGGAALAGGATAAAQYVQTNGATQDWQAVASAAAAGAATGMLAYFLNPPHKA